MLSAHKDLGIAYISSYLKKQGHTVLLRYMTEDLMDYTEIVRFRPDLLGMTVYDVSKELSFASAKKIKELLPNIKICFGGYYSSYNYLEAMERASWIDFIIRGEGEEPLAQLLRCLENGLDFSNIAGLVYRDSLGVKVNPRIRPNLNLNQIPAPDRSQEDLSDIGTILNISTSRGCTSNCSFCSSKDFWQGWRGKDPDNVIQELESILSPEKIYMVTFLDSSFEDPDSCCNRLRRMAENLIKSKLKICYHANFRANFYKRCDENLIALLKKSGLTSVFIGFEAGNEEDLILYNKSSGLTDNINCSQFFIDNNILINPGFINFNPYSTTAKLAANVRFLNRFGYACDIFLLTSQYSAYSCGRLYHKMKQEHLFIKSDPGEFDYKFVDNRVQILLDYTRKYIKQLNQHDFLMTQIKFFTFHHEAKIRYLMAIAENARQNNIKLIENLNNALEQNKRLRYLVSQKICTWFEELIQLTEHSQFHYYDTVSKQLLPIEEIQKLFVRFNEERNKCIKTLIRYGLSEYVSVLNVKY